MTARNTVLGWVAPRESRALSTSARDNLTHAAGQDSPVASKVRDNFGDQLPDQSRLVLIGRPFAVRFLSIPFHGAFYGD